MKNQWKTPRLLSLVKGGPGEAILSACKVSGNFGGPISAQQTCRMAPNTLCEERARRTRVANGIFVCMDCSDQVAS